jgi:hypothetical protein
MKMKVTDFTPGAIEIAIEGSYVVAAKQYRTMIPIGSLH